MFCFFLNEFHGILVGNKPASVKAFRFTDLGHSPTFLPRQQRKNKTKRCCSVKKYFACNGFHRYMFVRLKWIRLVRYELNAFLFISICLYSFFVIWCDCPHLPMTSVVNNYMSKSYQLIDYSLLILSFKYIIILIRDMYHRGGCVGVNCRSWPNWSTICQRHPDIYEHSALH